MLSSFEVRPSHASFQRLTATFSTCRLASTGTMQIFRNTRTARSAYSLEYLMGWPGWHSFGRERSWMHPWKAWKDILFIPTMSPCGTFSKDLTEATILESPAVSTVSTVRTHEGHRGMAVMEGESSKTSAYLKVGISHQAKLWHFCHEKNSCSPAVPSAMCIWRLS